jgi:hypothetical protein
MSALLGVNEAIDGKDFKLHRAEKVFKKELRVQHSEGTAKYRHMFTKTELTALNEVVFEHHFDGHFSKLGKPGHPTVHNIKTGKPLQVE